MDYIQDIKVVPGIERALMNAICPIQRVSILLSKLLNSYLKLPLPVFQ